MNGVFSKKKVRKILSVFMVIALLCPLLSSGSGQINAAAKKKVKSVKVTKPVTSTLTMKKGSTYQLKVKVLPQKATNKKVTFQSKKKSVVSVSAKGKLKAKNLGSTVITVKAKDGSKKKASVTVNVVKKFTKVKQVTLNCKSTTLYLNGTKSEDTLALKPALKPKNATSQKVNYVSSKSAVATVNKNGVVTAKSTGSTIITAYAADGWGKKATCTIKVEKKNTQVPTSTNSPALAPTSIPTSVPTLAPTPVPIPEKDFTVAANGKATNIYIDNNADDYEGLNLVAESFASDVNLVNGTTPEIKTTFNTLEKEMIVAGSIGNNQLIDKWIQEGKIQVSDISGCWETYKVIPLVDPEPGVSRAIVIVGSDKRGTMYGIFHISELMGVSPWVYWGDALPEEQEEVVFKTSQINYTSKEPSVKYRGIFLNDEAPSLDGWATNKFGSRSSKGCFNEQFYDLIFNVILRLKGNYLWPAMWNSAIGKDGKSTPLASLELANAYGIVMGTSHHEPMMLGEKDWTRNYTPYVPQGTNAEKGWNFYSNSDGLKRFWEDGTKERGEFDNLITMGMRGMGDSKLLENATLQDNVDHLKDIITAQKEILKDNNLEDAPKVLTLYKEVEEYWHGSDTVEGLKHWEGLDDVTIMLAEDNFGNTRTLPTKENRDREKGWGMYYHFDYHGGPTSYEWINTSPLEKTWEQMSMAYDYGIDQVWIVNVGDLKPMEIGISYFLDMAYDFDKWGTNGLNKTEEYAKQWVKQQFGEAVDEKGIDDITSLIQDYLQLNGNRKPEVIKSNTYSLINDNEAQELLQKAEEIISLADEYKEELPEKFQAPYYQLVYYPAVATATVNKMWVYKGLNELYIKQGRTSANIYAKLVDEMVQVDKSLQHTYNNSMPGVDTKWKNMMSSPHVGYITWNDVGAAYPKPAYITPKNGSIMLVAPKGTESVYETGIGTLPDFTNINKEHHYIDIANGGDTMFDFTASASADWILLTETSGEVISQNTIGVSIDWNKVTTNQNGTITITGAGETVIINVFVDCIDVASLDDMTFVEAHNVVSMDAHHFSNKEKGANGTEWKVIDNYGRTGSSVKTFPTTDVYWLSKDAPFLEYKVYVKEAGTYTLQSYMAPTNNVDWERIQLGYYASVGEQDSVEVNTLKNGFKPGDYNNSWPTDVTDNIRKATSSVTLNEGINTIRIHTLDAALVFQKFVLYRTADGVKSSYLGPKESYFKGKNVESKLVVDVQEDQLITN